MAGQRIGYVRVSTFEQNAQRQLDEVAVDRLFTDKASGKDTNGRSSRRCSPLSALRSAAPPPMTRRGCRANRALQKMLPVTQFVSLLTSSPLSLLNRYTGLEVRSSIQYFGGRKSLDDNTMRRVLLVNELCDTDRCRNRVFRLPHS
jgi:hypothetical protein